MAWGPAGVRVVISRCLMDQRRRSVCGVSVLGRLSPQSAGNPPDSSSTTPFHPHRRPRFPLAHTHASGFSPRLSGYHSPVDTYPTMRIQHAHHSFLCQIIDGPAFPPASEALERWKVGCGIPHPYCYATLAELYSHVLTRRPCSSSSKCLYPGLRPRTPPQAGRCLPCVCETYKDSSLTPRARL